MENKDNRKLPNCDNHYTVEDLYDRFGIDERETKICMRCRNHLMEGGIITCKYIKNVLDGIDSEDD